MMGRLDIKPKNDRNASSRMIAGTISVEYTITGPIVFRNTDVETLSCIAELPMRLQPPQNLDASMK